MTHEPQLDRRSREQRYADGVGLGGPRVVTCTCGWRHEADGPGLALVAWLAHKTQEANG